MYKYTLQEWTQLVKPEDQLIVQASTIDGGDRLTNTSIGMCWPYIHQRGNTQQNQIGEHTELVYCAISENTDKRRRGNAPINRKQILVKLSNHGIQNIFTDPDEYYKNLPRYKFVISPEGNGIDCHRHYEALMAGCIPIVEDNSYIREKYGNAPILYTTDYSEINETYLLEKYQEMLNQEWDFSKLYMDSWSKEEQDRIKMRGNFWCMKWGNQLWYREPTVPL